MKTRAKSIAVLWILLTATWGGAHAQQTGTCRVGGALCASDADCLGQCSLSGALCSGPSQCNLPGDACIDKVCDPLPVASACNGIVDPDCYLTISLGGRRQGALLAPYVAKQDIWEVVPTRGALEVSFDLDEMKRKWDFDTAASLSMWARKVPRPDPNDGAGAAIEIGIPPYSSLVEGLQIRPLDLAAAGNLMNQMFQGSRIAHRMLHNERVAEIARLDAELRATRALRAAFLEYLEAAERALTLLYTESLRFRLDVADVEQAAGILSAADEAVEEARRRTETAALDAAANAVFFAQLKGQRAGIDSWLAGLQSDDVKPYMPVISSLIERPENVIAGVVASVEALLASVKAEDAEESARTRARGGLVAVARELIDIETALHLRYREMEDASFAGYERRPQYRARQVRGFAQEEIEALSQFMLRLERAWADGVASVPCGVGKGAQDDPSVEEDAARLDLSVPDPDSGSRQPVPEAEDEAQKRFETIEPLLQWIRGGRLPAEITREIKERFESQIEPGIERLREIDSRIAKLEVKLARARHKAGQFGSAVGQCERQRDRISNTIATLLMLDIMDALIDQIVPGTLALENADLDPGDRLEILVSFSKPATPGKLPPAQAFSFVASPYGWRAPLPYITDATSYAKPEGANDYEFRPGVLAVWNYYGKARKLKSPMRTLAPGFGIHAIALQFSEDDEADDEFGIGVGVTLFDNLLTFAYGWNLQAKSGDSRNYLSVGFSVRRAMEKFAKQE